MASPFVNGKKYRIHLRGDGSFQIPDEPLVYEDSIGGLLIFNTEAGIDADGNPRVERRLFINQGWIEVAEQVD